MDVRVIAAVLFLLVVEAGMLAYVAAGFRPVRTGPADATAGHARAPGLMRLTLRSRSAGPDRPIDLSMAGRPFHVSDSVVEDCRHFREWGCRALDDFLGAMANERRDADWAARTETRLAHVITRDGRRDYRIRALECRSSLCAIELASDSDYPRISLSMNDTLDRELAWSGSTASAWEQRADGLTIVTVVGWVRRPRSQLEDPAPPVTDDEDREQQRQSAQPEQQ